MFVGLQLFYLCMPAHILLLRDKYEYALLICVLFRKVSLDKTEKSLGKPIVNRSAVSSPWSPPLRMGHVTALSQSEIATSAWTTFRL